MMEPWVQYSRSVIAVVGTGLVGSGSFVGSAGPNVSNSTAGLEEAVFGVGTALNLQRKVCSQGNSTDSVMGADLSRRSPHTETDAEGTCWVASVPEVAAAHWKSAAALG